MAVTDLQRTFIPGIIAGTISIFTSWLWMAVIFHRFQNRTPETWRRETGLSHTASSAVHVLAAIAIAILFTALRQNAPGLLGTGMHIAVAFALIVWAVFALPVILNAAIYIRLHPLVVAGHLLDWLTTSLLATLFTAWWQRS